MKNLFLIIAVAICLTSCDKKTAEAKEVKTAYVDTSKLMEEYTEAKDIQGKYKEKSEVMGKQLEAEATRLKSEQQNFQANAQKNGQTWAKEKYAELQKRDQQLQYAQQQMLQQLQQDSGAELDTVVKSVKKFIKDYGKEKGYSYIYGTGETASILYAEDKYDITKELIKLLNDKYKAPAKTTEKPVTKK